MSLDDEYTQRAGLVRGAAEDPEGFAMRLRHHLDFLPGSIADGVVQHHTQKLTALAGHLPQDPCPPSAIPSKWEPSQKDKRGFIRKFDAVHDPFTGLTSNDPAIQELTEQLNPETVREIKSRVVDRIASTPNLPFRVKSKLSAVLGAPALSSQDPASAGDLQQLIRASSVNKTDAGQAGSARNSLAKTKQDKATLSTAQKLMSKG